MSKRERAVTRHVIVRKRKRSKNNCAYFVNLDDKARRCPNRGTHGVFVNGVEKWVCCEFHATRAARRARDRAAD